MVTRIEKGDRTMKCAKPNKNGEYAAKRVSNDRGAYDASINMNAKGGRARSRGSVLAKSILLPLLFILVFSLVLLGTQMQEISEYKFEGVDFSHQAVHEYNIKKAQAAEGLWSNDYEYLSGGSGTDNVPYLIANARQLAYLAKLINDNVNAVVVSGGSSVAIATIRTAVYKLTADIDLSAHF